MSGLGVAIGIPAAAASTALLKGVLFGVAGQKPAIVGAGAVMMIGVALAASYLPERRATRVDPMVALRQESVACPKAKSNALPLQQRYDIVDPKYDTLLFAGPLARIERFFSMVRHRIGL